MNAMCVQLPRVVRTKWSRKRIISQTEGGLMRAPNHGRVMVGMVVDTLRRARMTRCQGIADYYKSWGVEMKQGGTAVLCNTEWI